MHTFQPYPMNMLEFNPFQKIGSEWAAVTAEADGKANATRMSLDALCRYFNVQADYQIIPPAPSQPRITADTLSAAYLQMYDPRQDSNALKTHPELFEKLRGDYPLRREKEAYTIVNHPE